MQVGGNFGARVIEINIEKYIVMKKIVLIFMISIFACSSDQNEKKYNTYEEAKLDNLFEKGWIPKELVYNSMSNIIVKNNLDLNTCFFSYNLSQRDFENIKSKIHSDKIEYKKPERIDISKSEIEKINMLNKYSFVLPNKTDTIQIATDAKEDRIYGWY